MRAPPACFQLCGPSNHWSCPTLPTPKRSKTFPEAEFIRLSWAFSVQEQIHFALFAVLGCEELTLCMFILNKGLFVGNAQLLVLGLVPAIPATFSRNPVGMLGPLPTALEPDPGRP